MKHLLIIPMLVLAMGACKNNSSSKETETLENKTDSIPTSEVLNDVKVTPIEHASMVLNWGDTIIYVDPVGGGEKFLKFTPDLILLTDIHQDHLDLPTLKAVVGKNTRLIVPKAVFEMLPEDIQQKSQILNNGETVSDFGISVEAIPMYNLRKEALQYHPKGRGNGYVLEKNDKRLYISGDTEDIAEMRNLKNIDIAFVCMNLPYTMTVEKAAEAVLAFRPKTVYPYHFRGTEGFSDVEKFRTLVSQGNPDIKVVLLDWYPK